MTFSVAYEVFVRYVLNAPTTWSFTLSWMLGATIVTIGFAYVLRHRGHVSVDLIQARFPTRVKLIIEVVFTAVLFFPLFFMLAKVFVAHAWWSYSVNETATDSAWYPTIWPFKIALAYGFVLLFLQGIVNFAQDVAQLAGRGREA